MKQYITEEISCCYVRCLDLLLVESSSLRCPFEEFMTVLLEALGKDCHQQEQQDRSRKHQVAKQQKKSSSASHFVPPPPSRP